MTTIETDIGTIKIREAKISDANNTVKFMNWVTGEVDFHTYGVNDFNIRPEDEERMIHLFNQRNNCLFLIATFCDEIVSVATLSGGTKDRVMHRGTIGITVAKRFWRLGIGMKMMQYMITFSEKSSIISKLELVVHENNHPAIQMYNKLGFFREGSIQRYFHIDGEYYDGVQMGLIVD